MNMAQMKAAQKELLKNASEIVEEAIRENKIPRMCSNNIERLKIEVYKTIAYTFREELKKIENVKNG